MRFPDEPIELFGFRRHVIETVEPLMIDEDVADAAERTATRVLAGEMPKSLLFVPLVAGGRATGVISLQNLDREHAFTDSTSSSLRPWPEPERRARERAARARDAGSATPSSR